ncbi:Xaa-Pro dipeptidyl-peptidase [Lipingzhangella sp. LS1_29]|uniref:Xaa-Pro dipeptidyl-peptidase n=1 Tax=Lipingzhangella rawalii TaxID=2055835 RepID=A0ABU2H2Q4_9ACTN|nr:Xaa-Pro dipeptidyl-peptidase [Lipingzhangella rawalii]MDS1269573.1 Xaa-Pro dipeptidyl-peptidase [Lipingzhangella rawalii]
MRSPHRPIGRIASVTTATVLMGTVLMAPARGDTPELTVTDERTQPVFDYADAVYQEVDIETDVDSDGDGNPDTVRLRVLRPGETEHGLQVATIIEPSPYWAGLNPLDFYDVDRDDEDAGTVPPTGPRPKLIPDDHDRTASITARDEPNHLSGYYDNYFLPRGYAVAQLDSLGSNDATGCPTSGGPNETAGVRAAVDWLNGRTTGTDPEGNKVTATDWSTGNAAMTGISYNGTLSIAAATTGVEGLRTIVPQGAISSWYEYFRENGAVRAPAGFQGEDADVLAEAVYTRDDDEICEPVLESITTDQARHTGDYTDFWDERNYRNDVSEISASVFLAHGLTDWNVNADQALRLWQKLGEHEVPRKLWLYQAGHVNPFNLRIEEWLDQLHAWFDHWLYDLDTGIMDHPPVDVQNADLGWTTHETWPVATTQPVRMHLNGASPNADTATGGLTPQPGPGRGPQESFTDEGRTVTADELAAAPESSSGDHALVYLSEELSEDVRISGTPEVSLRAAMNGPSPYLTALLVDYGTDTRATGAVEYDPDEEVCFGDGVPADPGCTIRSYPVTETSEQHIVTRGSLDARNRTSLERGQPVVSDRMYRYSWQLNTQDYVFQEGHRIGVVLLSTDHDFTLRYPPGTDVTVDTNAASITLPIAQGRSVLR